MRFKLHVLIKKSASSSALLYEKHRKYRIWIDLEVMIQKILRKYYTVI